jgi:para-aminobenzoate synthetase/4-amino-4-deoxychorismate lyase
VTPVCRPLDWDLSPADVLRLVRDDPHPAALLGAWAGGSDIVTSCPVRMSELPEDDVDEPPGACRFGGGWIGYLGYGASARFLPVPPPAEPRRLPDSWFGYYDHVLRRDRRTGQWTFESLDGDARLGELLHRARTTPLGYECGEFELTPSPAEHEAAVAATVSRIRRGDLFQANICLRLEAGFTGDPLDAFCAAATALDPPYAAFLRPPHGAIASLSPELFLRHHGPGVLSQPIKGTTRRSDDELTAQAERETLERSVKDQAENVMIVDLMRNDLSRVCVPGSVQVPALLRAQAHPGVWHLVSDVCGTLAPGTTDTELIRATFPPGSVTGAPKVRALEVIGELEATPREVYTGAIGYRSPVAGLELNVAIRTFEFHDGRVHLGSGGGITASSDPRAEFRECLDKARPLIRALGGSLGEADAVRVRPASPRPRPALGVFTSLRVTDGHCAGLDAHLARLEASATELFGKPLPPGLHEELAGCLAGRPTGRLRITVKPAGGPLGWVVEVVPAGDAPQPQDLRAVTVPGGIGAHKWTDRRILGEGSLLITDTDSSVLETDRASVFAVIDGVLRTPPADGRLLPGVTRAAVLRLAAREGMPVAEGRLELTELARASEVFATNSVHGIVPVRSVDPAGTWQPGPVGERLRAALAAENPEVAGAPAHHPGPLAPARRGRWRQRPRAGGAAGGAGRVLLIDNYDSFTYNLAHLLRSAGAGVDVVRNDELTAADVAADEPAGIVISPGPGMPHEAGISVDVVRACGPDVPLLGICLGHQAIAAAYGADITTAPLPVHGQASGITHDGRGMLAGVPVPFPAARYHSLIVAEPSLPPELTVTARGPGRIVMGIRHASHPVEGVQFHPESILTAHGAVIIDNFLRKVNHAVRRLRARRPGRDDHVRQAGADERDRPGDERRAGPGLDQVP